MGLPFSRSVMQPTTNAPPLRILLFQLLHLAPIKSPMPFPDESRDLLRNRLPPPSFVAGAATDFLSIRVHKLMFFFFFSDREDVPCRCEDSDLAASGLFYIRQAVFFTSLIAPFFLPKFCTVWTRRLVLPSQTSPRWESLSLTLPLALSSALLSWTLSASGFS